MDIAFNSHHSTGVYSEGKLLVDLLLSDGITSKSDTIYFTVPSDFQTHNDLVATALATLCGRKKYDSIMFNFPISGLCKAKLQEFCMVEIQTPSGEVEAFQPGPDLILNFSGGFDSLALRYLLGNRAKLLAVDFGGSYKREADFFNTLSIDYVCGTDFRLKKYDEASWTFMGAASILYAQYANAGGVTFGTILEAEDGTIYRTEVGEQPPIQRGPFSASRLEYTMITHGLTEFGTTMIVEHAYPDLVRASLRSLANPGMEKYFRKSLILEIIRARNERRKPVLMDLPSLPSSRTPYGKYVTVDFLSIYFASQLGVDYVAQWVDGIEKVDLSSLHTLPLDFYFRLNTNFFYYMPVALRADITAQLVNAGIEPYCERDWRALDAVRNILRSSRT